MIKVQFDKNSKLYNIVDDKGTVLHSSQRELLEYGDYAVFNYHNYPTSYSDFYLYINNKLEKVKCLRNVKSKEGNSIKLLVDDGKFNIYAESKNGLKLIKENEDINDFNTIGNNFLIFTINKKRFVYSLILEDYVLEDSDFTMVDTLIHGYMQTESKTTEFFKDILIVRNINTNEYNLLEGKNLVFATNMIKIEICFNNDNIFYLECVDLTQQKFIFDLQYKKAIKYFTHDEGILPIMNDKFIIYNVFNRKYDGDAILNAELFDEKFNFIMKFDSIAKTKNYFFISYKNKLTIYRDNLENIVRVHEGNLKLEPNIWYSTWHTNSQGKPSVFLFPKDVKLNDIIFYATEKNQGYICNKTTLEILVDDITDYCKESDFNDGLLVFNKKTLKYETYSNDYDEVEVSDPITKLVSKEKELVFRQREIRNFSVIEGNDILDNCLLTKDELIKLGNKIAIGGYYKKSDLNSFMKKIYSTQFITEDEFKEIKVECNLIPWKEQTVKKDIPALIKKLNKNQLKEFAKDKNILEAKIFSIWSE